jgi:opacity protein-like surface antigen
VKRSLLIVAGLLSAAADVAAGQIIRPSVYTRPVAWTTAGIGWLQQQDICDPGADACWNFGGAPQYRGSLELPLGESGSWGFAMTSARVPMVWATVNPSPTSCAACNANVSITQYLAMLHMGQTARGFQQIVELGAGVTQFTQFRDTAGVTLGNGKAVTDFSFAVAYGFGYTLQSRLQLYLLQEYAMMIHKRTAGSSNNSAQQSTLRVGLRLSLGDR